MRQDETTHLVPCVAAIALMSTPKPKTIGPYASKDETPETTYEPWYSDHDTMQPHYHYTGKEETMRSTIGGVKGTNGREWSERAEPWTTGKTPGDDKRTQQPPPWTKSNTKRSDWEEPWTPGKIPGDEEWTHKPQPWTKSSTKKTDLEEPWTPGKTPGDEEWTQEPQPWTKSRTERSDWEDSWTPGKTPGDEEWTEEPQPWTKSRTENTDWEEPWTPEKTPGDEEWTQEPQPWTKSRTERTDWEEPWTPGKTPGDEEWTQHPQPQTPYEPDAYDDTKPPMPEPEWWSKPQTGSGGPGKSRPPHPPTKDPDIDYETDEPIPDPTVDWYPERTRGPGSQQQPSTRYDPDIQVSLPSPTDEDVVVGKRATLTTTEKVDASKRSQPTTVRGRAKISDADFTKIIRHIYPNITDIAMTRILMAPKKIEAFKAELRFRNIIETKINELLKTAKEMVKIAEDKRGTTSSTDGDKKAEPGPETASKGSAGLIAGVVIGVVVFIVIIVVVVVVLRRKKKPPALATTKKADSKSGKDKKPTTKSPKDAKVGKEAKVTKSKETVHKAASKEKTEASQKVSASERPVGKTILEAPTQRSDRTMISKMGKLGDISEPAKTQPTQKSESGK